MHDNSSKSEIGNMVDPTLQVDILKSSTGTPLAYIWSCGVQIVTFWNIKNYYEPIWCITIHHNP